MHTEMIHKNNVHHFDKIFFYSMIKSVNPFLLVDAIITQLRHFICKLSLNVIVNLLHKF